MRLYSDAQEAAVYLRRQAKMWLRSGLIAAEQLQRIEAEADPRLRQTNPYLRILYFLFTHFCLSSVVGFLTLIIGPYGIEERGYSVLCLMLAVPSYGLAEHLARSRGLYRHGVEEAMALAGIGFFCTAVAIQLSLWDLRSATLAIALCGLGTCAGWWLYHRFGYLYGALIGYVALSVIPFQWHLPSLTERALLAALLGGCLVVSKRLERAETPDFQKDRSAFLQGALFLGLYATINLWLHGLVTAIGQYQSLLFGAAIIPGTWPGRLYPPSVYWGSYALTFCLPIATIVHGVHRRERTFIRVGLITLVVSLMTNKSYLGLTRNSWDPAILGLLLMATAILVTRWLKRGPEQARHGFTPINLLKPPDHGIDLAAMSAALLAPGAAVGAPAGGKSFGGGTTGGGGGGRSY